MNKKIVREFNPRARVPVVNVGKAVVQETEEDGFMISLPDGTVKCRASRGEAEDVCHKFFKQTCPKGEISLGTIETRLLPKVVVSEVLQPT